MRIVIQLSGGKDSLAVLHMAREYRHLERDVEIIALFNDMGNSFPHIVDHVSMICFEWDIPLVISRPTRSVLDSIKDDGLPSDIVPIWASNEVDLFQSLDNKCVTRLQSGINCCNKHLYQPIMEATLNLRPNEVWRGSKLSDKHVTAGPSVIYKDITFYSPLWNFDDEQVFEYLKANKIPIPIQYHCGVNHSLDCIECTAWLDVGVEADRARFTRDYYPVEFEALRVKLKLVNEEVNRQQTKLHPFMKECGVQNE